MVLTILLKVSSKREVCQKRSPPRIVLWLHGMILKDPKVKLLQLSIKGTTLASTVMLQELGLRLGRVIRSHNSESTSKDLKLWNYWHFFKNSKSPHFSPSLSLSRFVFCKYFPKYPRSNPTIGFFYSLFYKIQHDFPI